MSLEEFQEDLRNGMTIHDALQKHGYTFQYVMENLPRAWRGSKKKQGKG